MLLPLLVSQALAAPADIAHGWYLAETGRPREAAHVAVTRLDEDPADLAAHRLYIWAIGVGLEDGAALETLYRSWLASDAENAAARVALAAVLSWRNSRPGPWCNEVEDLLDPLPPAPEDAYWSLRVRYGARRSCPADEAEDRRALLEMSGHTPAALGYALKLRLATEPVDQGLARDLARFYEQEPWHLGYVGDLWDEDVSGPYLEQARNVTLGAADHAAASEHPAEVYGALQVYERAHDQTRAERARARLESLDPGYDEAPIHDVSELHWALWDKLTEDPVLAAISRARRKATWTAAVEALEALERRIPPDGPIGALWLKELGMAQEKAGRHKAALESFRRAWEADPTNPSAGNAFAYAAALQGTYLEEALEVMDRVLEMAPSYDPWSGRGGYEAWQQTRADHLAARLDTRAWVYHGLGRDEEARRDLQHALLLARQPDPVYYHHLGLVCLDLDQPEAALEHISRGLALGPSTEPELDQVARATAQELFSGRRWAPHGLEGWVQTRARLAHPASQRPATSHPLAGQPIPALRFSVVDMDHVLSDFPGFRVIQVWASWCEPCIASLQALDRTAITWLDQDFEVLALSVDERPEAVASFWEGSDAPEYTVGWAGPEAMDLLHLNETPTTLIVDHEGVVQAVIEGWEGPEDHRVDRKLESLRSEETGEAG